MAASGGSYLRSGGPQLQVRVFELRLACTRRGTLFSDVTEGGRHVRKLGAYRGASGQMQSNGPNDDDKGEGLALFGRR